MKGYLTVHEFAREVGITVATLRAWLTARRVTSTKIGRTRWIPETEILRLVQEGMRPALKGVRRVA